MSISEQKALSPTQQILALFGQLSAVEKQVVMAELQFVQEVAPTEVDEGVYVPTTAVPLEELIISRATAVEDVTKLAAPWWPANETADDINNFVRQLRENNQHYGQTQTPDWDM